MSTGSTESIFRSSAAVCGRVSAEQLDYALRVARHRQGQQGIQHSDPVADRLLAEILVEQDVLTAYQADQLLAGRTKLNLGPYIITDWIGQGGMGQVFKAVHQVMGRECAVKVLPLARATQESKNSFAREIKMQANLDCPYLVRAFDAGQDGNVHYLVTEYVPGMDLRRLVKSRGPLPVQQAANIIMQAALGLAYAHSKDLVHRDVKPGNILVTPQGDAKVSDVGLAGFAKDLINDPRAGKIVGTTDYLSPEQIRTPLQIRPTSDIYSLGCTLYYTVCGKVPFPGGDTASKLRRHLDETPWHPRKFAADIPEDFVDIIADMMEKDPQKRIAKASEVASRLEPWVSESMGLGGMMMTRSPWMPPPLPSHDEEKSSEVLFDSRLDTQASDRGQAVTSSDLAYPIWDPLVPAPSATSGDNAAFGSPLDLEGAHLATAPDTMRQSPPPATGNLPPRAASVPAQHDPATRLSSGMIIALTIAVVLPPALLIGAILGYIMAQ